MTETPSRGGGGVAGEGANQGTLALLEAGRGSEQTLPESPGGLTLLTVLKPPGPPLRPPRWTAV